MRVETNVPLITLAILLLLLSDAELETARRDGVLSTFSFEGEKPGFYRISVAVRDNYSGTVGNSRVFYEISSKDLNKSSRTN